MKKNPKTRAAKFEVPARSLALGDQSPNVLRALFGLALLALLATPWSIVRAEPGENPALLAEADQILNEISHIRRLAIESPVRKGVKSKTEIKNALQEKLTKEFSAEELEKERRALVQLGLLPPDYDYVNGALLLLEEQIAGYYDPDSKTFYIADWLSGDEQKATMAHELTHALQDQHFHLDSVIENTKGNDDRLQARRALVEGEAVAVMFDYLLRPVRKDFLNLPDLKEVYTASLRKTRARQKLLDQAPAYLRETLLFPYVYGSRFLQVYRRWHKWEDVAKLYEELPASTEQIMHPGKYAGMRDDPTEVTPLDHPRDFGEAWTSVYSNVLGEFGTYLLLKTYVSESIADRASKGWDGDSFQLFEGPDGRQGLFLRSVWDTGYDAEQFFEAYQQLIAVKYPDATPVEGPEPADRVREWAGAGARVRMELNGDWISIWEMETGPGTAAGKTTKAPERTAP